MPTQRICDLRELKDKTCREFDAGNEKERPAFVVRKGNLLFAYENSCPHTGVTLNWRENRFLDGEERYILCAVHGALFEIETGLCVFGPCRGDKLTPLTVSIAEEEVRRAE